MLRGWWPVRYARMAACRRLAELPVEVCFGWGLCCGSETVDPVLEVGVAPAFGSGAGWSWADGWWE